MLIKFILPSYNEEKILEKNTLKVFSFLKKQNYDFNWSLVVLINGSSDNSEIIAKNISKKNPEIENYIIKEGGKGNAIKEYLNNFSADLYFYMDIDLAVSLENINDLIAEWKKSKPDIIIGSRLKAGAITNRSFLRELSSRIYILTSKLIIKHGFSDLQCGFKSIKKEAWQKLAPFIENKQWFFDTEMLIFANSFNLKVSEIAVNWSENRYEKRSSKIKLFRDSFSFIKNLIKLKKRLG